MIPAGRHSPDHRFATGATTYGSQGAPAVAAVPSEHARFFEQLCRSVSFALIATDEHLMIRFWNDMATRMFDAPPERMIGQPVIGFFPEAERPAARKILSAAQQEGQPGDLEFTLPAEGGKTVLVTAVVAPIGGADGLRLGVSIGVRDITQRRERTRKLARGRRMASLGQMAGGVAHHFNNILGGAMTRLEFILSMMKPGDRFHRDLARVLDAIGRASRISGQLLTFAEGDHEPGMPGDLAAVIGGSIADLSPEFTRHNIRIISQIQPIRPVQAESRRLRAVLSSLTQNAIDAMPNGGEVRIELSEEEAGVLLVFADTGPGIPEDKLERVFEPFFTTKGSLGGGAGKGTGLSLSVVHGFITDMGGRIEVSSAAGKGTRFEIRLPFAAHDPAAGKPAA